MKTYLGLSIARILNYRLATYRGVLAYSMRYMIPHRDEIKRIGSLRNTKGRKRAFVFGNGPSMNKLSPEKVLDYQNQGYDVIAVNNFLYSETGQVVTPDFHVFSDPLDFVDVPTSHPRWERSKRGKEEKEQVFAKGIPVFAPLQYCDLNDYASTYYFCDVENLFSTNIDLRLPRGYLSWTGMKALAAACFLGYERIYICGMDYDMFRNLRVDQENNCYWTVEHFYDDDSSSPYVIKKTSHTSGEVLYLAHLNLVYHDRFTRFPVINLDPSGLVDAFPKRHALDVYRT
jgi:hypothetical protein